MTMQPTYLFFRARDNDQDTDQTLQDLREAFVTRLKVHPQEIIFGEDRYIWKGGAIFRITQYVTKEEISRSLGHQLVALDSWAIFKSTYHYLEHNNDQLIQTFVALMRDRPIVQIYLMAFEDDYSFQRRADELQGALAVPSHRVFRLGTDGLVLFAATSESSQILSRRCALAIRTFQYWAIIDRGGEMVSGPKDAGEWEPAIGYD
jgi:hypothetical protein